MEEYDKHILLAKWAEGTLTDEEAKALKELGDLDGLKSSLEDLEEYDFAPLDVDALWEKTLEKRQARKMNTRRLIPAWLLVAASILVIAGLVLWIWTDSGTTVVAEAGEKKEIVLPGKSKVVLNAGSDLHYFEKDWQNIRRMRLNGEAFFEVTKGVTFRVEYGKSAVEVLGTQFDVFARGSIFKVVCYEGKVRVSSPKANLQKVLQKGDGVRAEGSSYVVFEARNDSPRWTKGISVFTKTSLSEVFMELKRQYDLELAIFDINLHRQFSGEFPHDDLKGALERICGAMNLKYEIKNDKKVELRPVE